ncbi:MAG: hypothetical protein WDZ76_01490 [Pseudohongiellaceae bacterium]
MKLKFKTQAYQTAAVQAVVDCFEGQVAAHVSRGLKGCFVYCTDAETNEYFKQALARNSTPGHSKEKYPGLTLVVSNREELPEAANAVPIYDLQAAAGGFSEYQNPEEVTG